MINYFPIPDDCFYRSGENLKVSVCFDFDQVMDVGIVALSNFLKHLTSGLKNVGAFSDTPEMSPQLSFCVAEEKETDLTPKVIPHGEPNSPQVLQPHGAARGIMPITTRSDGQRGVLMHYDRYDTIDATHMDSPGGFREFHSVPPVSNSALLLNALRLATDKHSVTMTLPVSKKYLAMLPGQVIPVKFNGHDNPLFARVRSVDVQEKSGREKPGTIKLELDILKQ